MRKPNGYEEAQAYSGDFERITPGAYICKVMNVQEEVNNGIWQLAIAFDIAEGEHTGFYRRQHDRWQKKWPGVYRQTVEGKDGKCSPFFKGMLTAIEEGNPGYTFDFDNEKGLIGKLFGGIFGEEEYLSSFDGEIKTACKCVQIRSVKAVRDGNYKVPEKRLYKPEKASAAPAAYSPDAFAEVSMDDCPF